jgi:ParB-like chromosome segregation protein Spo0J
MAKKQQQHAGIPGATLARVAPDLLEFDPENPRFGGAAKNKTQDQIAHMLLEEPHLASQLVDSLVENGFIDYEPLVVRKKGDKYVVIEGNRRLAAVKYLRAHADEYPDKKDALDEIPVLVFSTKQTADERKHVRAYLGVRHLLGIREWPPLSKAQFLDRESKAVGSLDTVLKEVRLSKTQARRFLIPYRLLKDADRAIPDGEDFWVLAEALNRAGIKEYMDLEVDNELKITSYSNSKLGHVLDDLYGPLAPGGKKRVAADRKVAETRNLSLYAKVLKSEKARSVLHDDSKELAEAAIYVDTREESLARLQKLVIQLKVLVNKIAPASKKAADLRQAISKLERAVKAFVQQDA